MNKYGPDSFLAKKIESFDDINYKPIGNNFMIQESDVCFQEDIVPKAFMPNNAEAENPERPNGQTCSIGPLTAMLIESGSCNMINESQADK